MNFWRMLRSIAINLGVDESARTAIVQARMVGERIRRVAGWRPLPSDAIVLSGSGRSGTTWMADLLCSGTQVQQIFEPLHPVGVPEVQRLLGWDESRHPHIRSRYIRPGALCPEWKALLEKILCGEVRNYWTDYDRTAFFPDRYLVKLIRANLMLGFISDEFRPKIIHVVRSPCAVVASRLKYGWHADIRDVLDQEELVTDHLSDHVDDIARENDALGAHAVWWAVENAIAQRDLESRPHLVVYYEVFRKNPKAEMRRIAEFAGLKMREIGATRLERPSRMRERPAELQSQTGVEPRREAQLTAGEQARILDWADRLGVRRDQEFSGTSAHVG